MKQSIYLIFAIAAAATASRAGQAGLTGEEPGLWTDRHHCVVVGIVQDLHEVQVPAKGYLYYTANLILKANLAGDCDPSVTPMLPVRFVANMHGSSNHVVPPEGSLVIAFVSVGWPKKDHNDIEDAVTDFMPGEDGSGLFIVKDMNDPRIDETLKEIQKARARGAGEQAKGAPTTAPATR